MKLVKRFDSGSLVGELIRMPNGWLRTTGTFTRAGVFRYRQDDGTIRRELRPPEEVFDPESVRTLEMVPVTDKHPPEGILDADTTKDRARGSVGNDIRQDGMNIVGSVLVYDGALIEKAESGMQRELSPGYLCRIDATPGVWEGQPYDVVQRHIRYNHVAVVPRARGGEKMALRLDAEDAVQTEPDQGQTQGAAMKKIVVNGKEIEVADEVAARLDAADAENKRLSAEADALKAKADVAEAELKKQAQVRADAADPVKVQAAVKARRELEAKALTALGEDTEVRLDELDDAGVKAEVIKARYPEIKLDSASEAYINGLFDAAVAAASKDNGISAARAAVEGDEQRSDSEDDVVRMDSREVRAKFMREQQSAWQKPLSASKK